MPSYLLHLFWYFSALFWHVSDTPSLSPALTNLMKKGEMTGEREEGEGEANLGPKELGLIVLGCSRQTEWLCCDIQLYPAALADNSSALECHKHVSRLSILKLELLLNEAVKCCNFLLGFAHLETKLNFLKPVLPLLAPKEKESFPFPLCF